MSDQSSHLNPDPYAPISAAALAKIVAAPDPMQLKAWNDANAQALASEGRNQNLQVVKNIQQIAAFVAQSEKPRGSQNLELVRALSLYNSTLSFIEVATGAVGGVVHTITKKIEPFIAFTAPSSMNLAQAEARSQAFTDKFTDAASKVVHIASNTTSSLITPLIEPGSMNLQASKARGQALPDAILHSPEKIVTAASTTGNAVGVIWQYSGTLPETTLKSVQAGLAGFKHQLVASITADNPSQAVGAAVGAGVTDLAFDSLDPGRKAEQVAKVAQHIPVNTIDWSAYAKLMGEGTQQPKWRQPIDLTKDMKIVPSKVKDGELVVNYKASSKVKITAEADPNGTMTYLVRAEGDRDTKTVTGTTLFLSAEEKFRQNGREVRAINSLYTQGPLDTNHAQFMYEFEHGATLEQAAKRTHSGTVAAMLGMTNVDVNRFEQAAQAGNFSRINPKFTFPVYSDDPMYQAYGERFARAHGERLVKAVPGQKPEMQQNTVATLQETLSQLPAHQREVVERLLQARADELSAAEKLSR